MTTTNTVLVAVGIGAVAVIGYMAYDKYYGTKVIAGVKVVPYMVQRQAALGVFGVGVAAPMVTL